MVAYVSIILFWILEIPYHGDSQKSEETTPFYFVTNLDSNETVGDITISSNITEKYTYDQINNIIYSLYNDFRNSNKTTEFNHYHTIAILIDVVCSDERYENNVEACDILSEFPLE